MKKTCPFLFLLLSCVGYAVTAADVVPTVTVGELRATLPAGVALTADHKGNAKSAFAFNGDSTGLECNVDITPEKMPVCTLVTWARYTGESADRGYQQVVSNDDGNYDRSIGIDDRAGQYGWSCFSGNQGVIGGFPLQSHRWVFLAAIYDNNARKVTFIADRQRAEASDSQFDHALLKTSLGQNPTHGEHFRGDIEPVKIYSRALSEEELEFLRQH